MTKQVSTRSNVFATVLWMLWAIPVFAQARAPELNVTIFRDLVRFSAPSAGQEMRVEVFNSTGERIFDSNFLAGQTQDWPLQNLQGQAVGSGFYAYTITMKDGAGVLKEMQRGDLIIEREREGLEAAPRISVDSISSNILAQPEAKPSPSSTRSHDAHKDPPAQSEKIPQQIIAGQSTPPSGKSVADDPSNSLVTANIAPFCGIQHAA